MDTYNFRPIPISDFIFIFYGGHLMALPSLRDSGCGAVLLRIIIMFHEEDKNSYTNLS